MFEIVYRYDPQRPTPVALPASPAEARRRLEDGNRAFAHVLDRLPHGNDSTRHVVAFDPRDLGVEGGAGAPPRQQPFAVVLGCCDARVPTELIFNQWCNELFVVRVAGNVLGADSLGSIDYAVDQLRGSVRLLVVLAHSGCGAVTAAVDVFLKPASYLAFAGSHPLRAIVDRIVVVARGAARALEIAWGADVRLQPGYRRALIETTVSLNAALTAYTLDRELQRKGVGPGIATVYGVYDLGCRCVRLPGIGPGDGRDAEVWLADPPAAADDFEVLTHRMASSGHIRDLLQRG